MNLLDAVSAKSIIKAINKDITAIEKFERKNEFVKSGIKILTIPPKHMMGIVPIKIEINNFFDQKEGKNFLDLYLDKSNKFFLKYQITANTLPIWIIADNE